MNRLRPCAIGWTDQILMVLLDAEGPLTSAEIGERARVIAVGPISDPDIAKRQAGDPFQECYRVLCRLLNQGLVVRTATAPRVLWRASDNLLHGPDSALRTAHTRALDLLYESPAHDAAND